MTLNQPCFDSPCFDSSIPVTSFVPNRTASLFLNWLKVRLSPEAWLWLDDAIAAVRTHTDPAVLFSRFSAIARRVGKADLDLTIPEVAQAAAVFDGWIPDHWTVDQVARTLLLLALPQENAAFCVDCFGSLTTAADVHELVALYQSLAVLPIGDRYRAWAEEGTRSNMSTVFSAIALRNPYPARYFDEAMWNQLVLKAIFMGCPLAPIWGLPDRANATLARMLVDYVRERRAANRTITPELWPLVEPFFPIEAALRYC